ncbi:RelA/SpoT domain-containing protein [Acuticoccus mangrovi]|uniref:RelA/SpoT domain-containing protein n=1 Tax=Acuticoccus mangrovi TaxID=2796142 RepID=A0A934IQV2_9HYPH|nr:RelA/SpoT domain-containing protein [Acuticoccus mangrovi]MBJ3776385.1 hypothetical protein [Acuticoccus mangrovi]
MKRVYAKELEKVELYLSRSSRRELYTEFQSTVTSELQRAFETPRLHDLVIEVFSRAEKDPRNPIKTDRKIALKLYKWNKSSTVNPPATPEQVHDIAGVTIVCNYPSDTDEICNYLKEEFSSSRFRIDRISFRDPLTNKGYRAFHIVAVGLGKFHKIPCEIQIKTLLAMSWGTKTHDLTYKPAAEIDRRLSLYMEKLTFVAQILDEQSEILKSLISDAWELDAARRHVASTELVMGIKRSSDQDAIDILSYVQNNKERLSVVSLSDDLTMELFQRFDLYVDAKGLSRDLCRVAAVYALLRPSGDRTDWAIELIDDWIDSIHSSDERNNSIVFRSLVCMALSEYEEALSTGREVLKIAAESPSASSVKAKANLAYFLSEAYFHRAFDESSGGGEIITEATEECAQEALDIIHDLIANSGGTDWNSQVEDTIGAVLISCSQEESGVRDGLDRCRRALNQVSNGEGLSLAKAFYSLHEKRAFRRLLKFG